MKVRVKCQVQFKKKEYLAERYLHLYLVTKYSLWMLVDECTRLRTVLKNKKENDRLFYNVLSRDSEITKSFKCNNYSFVFLYIHTFVRISRMHTFSTSPTLLNISEQEWWWFLLLDTWSFLVISPLYSHMILLPPSVKSKEEGTD